MEDFVVTTDSAEALYLKKKDPRLGLAIDLIGDMSCGVFSDGYAFVIEEIIGQALSNRGASVIAARLCELCGGTIAPETVARLTPENLREIGLSRSKAEYILGFNAAIERKELVLDELAAASDSEVAARLTKIKGIGAWTAKMYLLFVLGRADVVPFEDGAFMQSYRWLYNTKKVAPGDVKKRCAKWRPFVSIGVRYLYCALDFGLTKRPFREYASAKTKTF